MNSKLELEVLEEMNLAEYTEQVRAESDAYDPTFKIMFSEMGSGYPDMGTLPLIPAEVGDMIVGVIDGVFAPRLTNITRIRIFRRQLGTPGGEFPPAVYTGYTVHKADCLVLGRIGRELLIFAGTHITGVPLDEFGKRLICLEKDEIPDFFSE